MPSPVPLVVRAAAHGVLLATVTSALNLFPTASAAPDPNKPWEYSGLEVPGDIESEAQDQASVRAEIETGTAEDTPEKARAPGVGDSACDPNANDFSWHGTGVLPPVRDQAGCSGCWSFVALGAYESLLARSQRGQRDLSEQYLLNCAIKASGEDVGDCSGGWYGGAFDYLSSHGVAEESLLRYTGTEGSCPKVATIDERVLSWGYIGDKVSIPALDTIKRAICEYGPVASAIWAEPDFVGHKGTSTYTRKAVLRGPWDVNHALTVIGWSDERRAFHVRNSWGESWGDGGYGWVAYDAANIGYASAWATLATQATAAQPAAASGCAFVQGYGPGSSNSGSGLPAVALLVIPFMLALRSRRAP